MTDNEPDSGDDEDEELSPRERMKKMMGGEGEGRGGGMMGGMGGGMDPMAQMMGMGMGGQRGGGGDERVAKELQELRVETVKIRETLERIAESLED